MEVPTPHPNSGMGQWHVFDNVVIDILVIFRSPWLLAMDASMF